MTILIVLGILLAYSAGIISERHPGKWTLVLVIALLLAGSYLASKG